MAKMNSRGVDEIVSTNDDDIILIDTDHHTDDIQSTFTSVGIRRDMMNFVSDIAKQKDMQKRDILTVLLMGLALADADIRNKIIQYGKVGAAVLDNYGDVKLARVGEFSQNHPLAGANLRLTKDRMCE